MADIKVVIFSAPSGSGKSTIINYLMQQLPGTFEFSISATSRAPRGAEVNGKEYYFLSPEDFKRKIAAGDFLEYEEVYHDKFYGTLKSEVERIASDGKVALFDVDVKGALNVKRFYGDKAMSVFIQPPSIEELRHRLEGRATDAPDVIQSRIDKAASELEFAPKFDKVVVNDDLLTAETQTLDLVRNFIGK
ncbi:MAG: guanylate kinase [Paludibacteraceae bacterium]|jgi:guanylate kinase|nr:guanylate kinase [Paludibacteraceae bacterium]